MLFVTVLSVAALINTAVALPPLAPELMKKYSQRHSRWWSWRHHNHHHTHTGSGPSWTESPVVATSAIADPESLAISVASSVRSTLSSVYTFPYSTSSASSTAYPTASSSSSYLFPNATANSTRVRPTAYSPSSSFGCSITTSTSTLTITESITYTLFLPTTSSTNHTWTNTSSSVPYPPFPSLPPTNATALTNRTTFTPIPFPGSSSLAVETGTSSGALEALPIPVSADPIFTGSPSAVLHPVTTVSQTTMVTGGQATGARDPAALHCGIHGPPNGAYKMAESWEERRDVGVTLLGCFEFCEGANDGSCFSYSFYRDQGTGAPRCDLFGGSVADGLDSFIQEVPRVWYDIDCGKPSLVPL